MCQAGARKEWKIKRSRAHIKPLWVWSALGRFAGGRSGEVYIIAVPGELLSHAGHL